MTATRSALFSSSRADDASGRDVPVGDRRIIGADALNRCGPVLIAVLNLALLANEIADLRNGGIFAADRLRVIDRQRTGAAKAGANAAGGDGARQDHDDIGAEALDLLSHRLVGAVADRDHHDERGDADENAQHGQRRAHLVASDRLRRGGEDHQAEGPDPAGDDLSRPRLGPTRAFGSPARRRRVSTRLRSSETISPSRMVTTRSAKAAMSDSWVTTTMVTPCVAIERDQRLHDLMRCPRIEIAGRLVGKQQARRIDQGAGNGDTLLLAAGKLARRVALALAEAEKLQRCARALLTRRAVDRAGRGVIERQGDILDSAGARQEIEALEDEAETFAADAREFGLTQAGDIDAFERSNGRWLAGRGSRESP